MWGLIVVTSQVDPLTLDHPMGVNEKGIINKWQLQKPFPLQVGTDQKLYPCAFFSRRLTPAERNYDIGNREFLVVKLALEVWRHWLEGTKEPFLVWTAHKNLDYIQFARLNSRQARWSLFLT